MAFTGRRQAALDEIDEDKEANLHAAGTDTRADSRRPDTSVSAAAAADDTQEYGVAGGTAVGSAPYR